MPTLSNTIIQKNHYKSEEDATLAEEYFHDEVQLGHMIGLISFLEAKSWLGSCFQTSPIGTVPKARSPSKFCIIHDLSFKGVAGKAVNDWIDTDAPTHWVSFTEFAQFVNSFHLALPSMALSMYMLCCHSRPGV
jgi:hypothetical protein